MKLETYVNDYLRAILIEQGLSKAIHKGYRARLRYLLHWHHIADALRNGGDYFAYQTATTGVYGLYQRSYSTAPDTCHTVNLNAETCDCDGFQKRGDYCSHILGLQIALEAERDDAMCRQHKEEEDSRQFIDACAIDGELRSSVGVEHETRSAWVAANCPCPGTGKTGRAFPVPFYHKGKWNYRSNLYHRSGPYGMASGGLCQKDTRGDVLPGLRGLYHRSLDLRPYPGRQSCEGRTGLRPAISAPILPTTQVICASPRPGGMVSGQKGLTNEDTRTLADSCHQVGPRSLARVPQLESLLVFHASIRLQFCRIGYGNSPG